MRGNYFIKGLKIAFFVALAILAFGGFTMLLWNWLVPGLFDGPEIHFGQALGILVLSKILFGGFKGGWGGHCGCRHGRHMHWKYKLHARMESMSPEEREKFRQKMYRCGWDMNEKEEASSNQ